MAKDTNALLAERGKTHGEYFEHAACTQALMRVVMAQPNWEGLPDVIKETVHMVAHKLGRVLTGNPHLKDHYQDIAGYAILIVDRINDAQDGMKPWPPEAAIVPKSYVQHDGNFIPSLGLDASKLGTPGTPDDGGHHAEPPAAQPKLLLTRDDVNREFLIQGGRTATIISVDYEDNNFRAWCRVEDGINTFQFSVDKYGIRQNYKSFPLAGDLLERLPAAEHIRLNAHSVGMTYMTRDGRVAVVANYFTDDREYPVVCRVGDKCQLSYTVEGKFYSNSSKQHPSDLVSRVKPAS